MRTLSILIILFFSSSAKCQLSEVTYDIETHDTLSVNNYSTDWAEWTVEDNVITWRMYDKDSIPLLVEQYTIVSSQATETGFVWSYVVNTETGGMITIEFWIYEDRSKAVSHRYDDGVVRYSGNVYF